MTTVPFYCDAIYRLTPYYWKEKNLQKAFDEFFTDIVERMELQAIEKSYNNDERQKRFSDLLFQEKNQFSLQDVKDHVKSIVYGVRSIL